MHVLDESTAPITRYPRDQFHARILQIPTGIVPRPCPFPKSSNRAAMNESYSSYPVRRHPKASYYRVKVLSAKPGTKVISAAGSIVTILGPAVDTKFVRIVHEDGREGELYGEAMVYLADLAKV